VVPARIRLYCTEGSVILDLFAGPGGWDEGLRSIGITDVVGLEWDAAACATRAAAGHLTIRCDVTEYPTDPFQGKVRGLIASPPCQAWSMAGKGAGRGEVDRVHAAVELCRAGWSDEPLSWEWADKRTPLILQPLRWAWALRPAWIACEQVPPALDVWKHMADVFRSWGYAADARVLCAADYGVPQTRDRAFIIATTGALRWPEPTHAEKPEPSLFGAARKPWVTMAEALGWGIKDEPCGVVRGNSGTGGPDPLHGGSGSKEKYARARREGRWLNPGSTPTQPNRRLYALDEPAPTVGFGHDANNWEWVHERPATTLVGSFSPHMVAPPGHREFKDVSRQDAPGGVRITVDEAAVLQGFARRYPWQGTKSKRYEQVGNVVCPPVAAAIIGALETTTDLEAAA
jgi:DNA (cytosine-5)-methyltransferase 1